jgi:hypothetical protein
LGLTHAAAARHLAASAAAAARIPLGIGRLHIGAAQGEKGNATDNDSTHTALREPDSRFVQYSTHAAQF